MDADSRGRGRFGKRWPLILWVLLLVLPAAASGSSLTLPYSLEKIENSAFYGDSGITEVVLPVGIKSIGSNAFQACSNLRCISIPATVTSIGTDAFKDTAEAFLIECDAESNAMEYALAKNIDFDADTVCRALLIGNTDYRSGPTIYAPQYDIQTLGKTLSQQGKRSYEVTIREDLTASQILEAVSNTFADADSGDISLFYFAGHGNYSLIAQENGALVGIDYSSYVYASDLRDALDAVKGRKIVIIDACYSGGLIGRGADKEKGSISDPARAFMDAFLNGSVTSETGKLLSRGDNLASNWYYVITAAKGTEKSFETSSSGKRFGLFTYFFSLGCGYDYLKDQFVAKQADSNQDGTVTLEESYLYTYEAVQSVTSQQGENQTVQIFPEKCSWFGIIR